MAYNWPGMRKLSWDEVNELARRGELIGIYKLYDDGTEAAIEADYTLEEIVEHHQNGGEFGEEYAKVDVTELCGNCGEEVTIKSVGVQICPNCGDVILPCCMCENCIKDCGYMEDPVYLIFRDKKKNAEYWDEMDNLTMEYVKKLATHSMKDVRKEILDAGSDSTCFDIAKEVLQIAVNCIKLRGGIFPCLDEDM